MLPSREELSSTWANNKGHGQIDKDFTHRIGAGWRKWRLHLVLCVIRTCSEDSKVASTRWWQTDYVIWGGVLASQEFPCPAYESSRDEDAEMDVWHTKRDKIIDEDIWAKVRVAPVEDKMQEVRLR
ncbi:hypothetical protein H5410_045011 [Solanum commersonii]|uniref:Uncharacterized protein n=1 Tax=Solanum commersonii TaxID=4109 RepID=A0A9J5X8E1_SOLCO|nr:hypothetical protein H5410_045011 [Solanum commersonii]